MISVSGIVVLAKIFGFIKQMVTANAFGATIHTDIIALSEGLVANIDYLVVQALATAFIPTYIYAKSENEGKSKEFVSNTIKIFLLISFSISLIVFLAAPFVSRILAPTYPAEQSAWLAKYIRIVAPVLIVIVELAIFNALLKANEVFVPGEFIGLNQSLILIALVYLFGSQWGPDTLLVAFYAYAVFNLAFLMVYSRKRWVIRRGNPFTDPNTKKLMVMMGPLLLGFSMVFVNQQVDKIIVSGLGEGTVTAMNYAAVLSNFICTFVGSICGVLFTYVTKNVAEQKDREAAELTVKSMLQLATLLIPVSIITVTCSHDIVMIVFGRGKFDAAAVRNCATALIGYGCMFVPYVIREQFSRFQYAYGDSKKPMINSTIAILFNIVFSIVLSRFMGVLGVTLATSISVLISGVLNIIASRKRNQDIRFDEVKQHLPRLVAGILICLASTLGGRILLARTGVLVRFIVIVAFSMGIYVLITYPVLRPLINKLMRKEESSQT